MKYLSKFHCFNPHDVLVPRVKYPLLHGKNPVFARLRK